MMVRFLDANGVELERRTVAAGRPVSILDAPVGTRSFDLIGGGGVSAGGASGGTVYAKVPCPHCGNTIGVTATSGGASKFQ